MLKKITSQYASLFYVILRQQVQPTELLLTKLVSLSDSKYTSHLLLAIFFHIPKLKAKVKVM